MTLFTTSFNATAASKTVASITKMNFCLRPNKHIKFPTTVALALFILFFSHEKALAQTPVLSSANSVSNGITDGSVTLGQKNLVLFGFGLRSSSPLTITEFNIGITSPDSRNNYFSNYRLYKSADSIYSFDDTFISSTASWKKNNLNNLNLALSDAVEDTSATYFYFLMADYTNTTGSVPGTFQFNFSSTQRGDAVITSAGSFNTYDILGTNFNISPPSVTVTNENSGTNGITPSLITFGQKNVVLFGFGVNVKGISTISQFNITSTNNIGSYFSTGRLYRSADNVYSTDDLLIATVSIKKSTTTTLGIPNLSEAFDWSPTRYYFFVADYTTNGPVLNNTIQFKFTSGQASAAIIQSAPTSYSYNNFDIAGQTFVFARTTIWLGNAAINPSDWNNAENWSGGYVPGNTDIAYLGTESFLTQPVVAANASIGSIHLGTAQSVVLRIDSTATLNAGDIIQKTGDVSIADTIAGAGTILVNNFQLTDPTSNPVFSADHVSKIVVSVSTLSANNIILRSKTNGWGNNASFEVLSGTASVTGSIQTINAAASNTSTFVAHNGSTLNLSGATPFYLSSTGTNVITHLGTTNYNGTLSQTINNAVRYQNLGLSGSGTKTIEAAVAGTFKLAGNLSITSPATLAYSSNITSINIRGNIEGNAPLNPRHLPVNIGGNWTNTYCDTIGGTVVYDGAGDQIAGGSNYADVIFTNGGTKHLGDSAWVKGDLTVGTNTILNTADKLTLRADAYSNANIRPLLNGADIQGKVTVQSFITSGKRGHLTLSSPVYDTTSTTNLFTFGQLKKFMPLTGSGGPTNGFDEGAVVSPYGPTIRQYKEEAAPGQVQYSSLSHITNTLNTGGGFLFYFRGDRSNIYYKVNPPFITPENVTLEYSGYINKGQIDLPLSYTYYSSTTDNGFNLIGNPYPSSIDLQKLLEGTPFSRTWILKQDNTYAVYDVGLGTGTNGASRYIIPGQGFFVQANQSGQVLSFTEGCKVTAVSSTRIMAEKGKLTNTISALSKQATSRQYIKLLAKRVGDGFSDETIIAFKNGSSSLKTSEDAPYLGEASISFGSLSGDNELVAINYLPKPDGNTEVKLNVGGDTGSYSISLTESVSSEFSDILLHDKHAASTVSLISEPAYHFTIDRQVNSTFGSERFKVIFIKYPDVLDQQASTSSLLPSEDKTPRGISIYPNPVANELSIEVAPAKGAVEMKIYNMYGQQIKSVILNSSLKSVQNVADLPQGPYILKITDQKSSRLIGTEKFIKE